MQPEVEDERCLVRLLISPVNISHQLSREYFAQKKSKKKTLYNMLLALFSPWTIVLFTRAVIWRHPGLEWLTKQISLSTDAIITIVFSIMS